MIELLENTLDEEDNYQSDVFTEADDDEIALAFNKAKKRIAKKHTKFTKLSIKRKKKSSVLPKSVIDLQNRYDALAYSDNTTSKDWQTFYLSIEKLIMKQAYFNNFKKFISKDSDLWSHLISTLMDQIIPKTNTDGTKSCWYINKQTNKICKGYDPQKTNIGNFILNRIKWIIFSYNNDRNKEIESLTDVDLNPVPDNFEFPEIPKTLKYSEQLNVLGNSIDYVNKLNAIVKFHEMNDLIDIR